MVSALPKTNLQEFGEQIGNVTARPLSGWSFHSFTIFHTVPRFARMFSSKLDFSISLDYFSPLTRTVSHPD